MPVLNALELVSITRASNPKISRKLKLVSVLHWELTGVMIRLRT